MKANSSTNTFIKGMNLDADVHYIPQDQYKSAKNIRLLANNEGTTGVIQPIERIHRYDESIPADETILGTAVTTIWNEQNQRTEECGIVVVKMIRNYRTYNKLYVLTSLDTPNNIKTVHVEGYLQLEDPLAIVCNYESPQVSNVYISDGKTPLKVINLHTPYEILDDPSILDITPGCCLLPFEVVDIVSGHLPAGTVQYCYQLFNVRGVETVTSALSNSIPITSYSDRAQSKHIKGEKKGSVTDKGCRIKTAFLNDGRFDRIRIFSIIYLDANEIPSIYIINEVDIPYSSQYELVEFTYEDQGGGYLSQITIDEFNQLVPFEFTAKSIVNMQNRLFAANLQELTWDIDADTYDTRAYRCNSSGQIVLESAVQNYSISGTLNADGVITTTSGEPIDVALTHDCINPYNNDIFDETDANQYQYGYDKNGNLVLGGSGKNIRYRFVFTEVVVSGALDNSGRTPNTTVELSTPLSDQTSVKLLYEDGTVATTKNIFSTNEMIPNYSNPYMVSKYTGYMRDEIYRFGIIFYNKKNVPSPVHWIADIRMPNSKYENSSSSVVKPFHFWEDSEYYPGKQAELIGYAMGVQFTVENLPEDVFSWEIVRCDRTAQDKTIITQGVISRLQSYTNWGRNEDNYGNIDVRPLPWFNFETAFRTYRRYNPGGLIVYHEYWDAPLIDNLYEFVSPDICFSKDQAISDITSGKLCALHRLSSAPSVSTIDLSGTRFGDICVKQPYVHVVHVNEAIGNDKYLGSVIPAHNTVYIQTQSGTEMVDTGQTDLLDFAVHGVFKYFRTLSENVTNNPQLYSAYDIENCTLSKILPYQLPHMDKKQYAQPIGGKYYINESIAGKFQRGNHGYAAVLQMESAFHNSNPYYTSASVTNQALVTTYFGKQCSTRVYNVKKNVTQYGGKEYANRQNSVYISCGAAVDSTNNEVYCFGGDTYLGVLDYLNTSFSQVNNNVEDEGACRIGTVCYIPVETTFNLNLRLDDCYHRTVEDGFGQNLIQNEATALPSGHTQDESLYRYNTAYIETSGSKKYVPSSQYAISNNYAVNRITCSELKTNNEIFDSWCRFKFANYIDVESKYGEIKNLKVFNNKLYYFQNDAVGVVSVNERSLINDGNIGALTLGAGDILSRYDYLIVKNGSSVPNDRSITSSRHTMYWYDFDKNELCALGNDFVELSKSKNVQSYLNNLSEAQKNSARSFYDKKYNEVWFSHGDSTIVYNERLQAFTSFYSHSPQYYLVLSDKLISIVDNTLFRLQTEGFTVTPEILNCSIEFVNNKDVQLTKVFDNMLFGADIDTTLTDISFEFKTLRQTSELSANFFENADYREDTYRFAIPRAEISTEASDSYAERMRGKYLICQFKCDNINSGSFKIPYFTTTYRYSLV